MPQIKIDFFYTPGTDAANSFEISTATKKNYETSLIDHRVSHLLLQETHLLGFNLHYQVIIGNLLIKHKSLSIMISKKQCMLTVHFQCSLQTEQAEHKFWIGAGFKVNLPGSNLHSQPLTQAPICSFWGFPQPAERLGPKAAGGVGGAVLWWDSHRGVGAPAQLPVNAAVWGCCPCRGWAQHSPPAMCPQQWPSTDVIVTWSVGQWARAVRREEGGSWLCVLGWGRSCEPW